MAIELRIPELGESITEAEIAEWLVKEGDFVRRDDDLAMIESEKATLPLPAPVDGILTRIVKGEGEAVKVGELIGMMEEAEAGAEAPRAEDKPAEEPVDEKPAAEPKKDDDEKLVMPAAEAALAQAGLQAEQVTGSGPGGRILKEDVIEHVKRQRRRTAGQKELGEPESGPLPAVIEQAEHAPLPDAKPVEGRTEERVRMSLMRRKIAERLVRSQQEAALLTTFNEVDMSRVIELRKTYRDAFEKKYGVRLGFMSFFVKAVVDALKDFPALNAEVDGEEVIYKNYFDIGIAVGGGKGLVVPVVFSADRMSFAEIEMQIADYGKRAKENRLTPDELTGGTFTISNGGVFGSMLSTPIINPPQSGILGLHKIEERPIALNGEVVIRPMMYVAMTYDHRIVDGRESVQFLVRVKEGIEEPSRLLLEV